MPVPLKFAVWAALFTPVEVYVTVNVALLTPAAPGLNVTPIAQFEPAGRDVPQLLVSTKSALFAPVIVTPVMLRGAVPLLDNVKL